MRRDAGDDCDLNGTWATYVEVDVTWCATLALAAGKDKLRQWLITTRAQTSNAAVDTGHWCGVYVPDFTSSFLGGGETFGVRFPNALFDSGGLPDSNVLYSFSSLRKGGSFTSPPSAILVGLTMSSAETTTWPSASTSITPRDDDHDGRPGITAVPAQGIVPGVSPARQYSEFPTDIPLLNANVPRADELYMVIRTAQSLSGVLETCDRMTGNVSVSVLNGKAAIDSHILSCRIAQTGSGSGQPEKLCDSNQSGFVDGQSPTWVLGAGSKLISVRVDPSTTCADVRGMKF
jgi:hypothetical protein